MFFLARGVSVECGLAWWPSYVRRFLLIDAKPVGKQVNEV